LNGLGKELHDETYQAQPVRRVMIPKPGGGERPLGIPNIRDRVAQTAAKLILEPIWEAELEPNVYGYRPGRSAQEAVEKVDELLHSGYSDVVDADLSKYFDTIGDWHTSAPAYRNDKTAMLLRLSSTFRTNAMRGSEDR